jgi:Ca2+-binding RTX toxin-like protein
LRRVRLICALTVFFVGVLASPRASAISAIRVVDDDGFATPADCDDSSTGAYTTIQDALADSAAGDTIRVCPGNYGGGIIVDKDVTLDGVGGPVITSGDFTPTQNGGMRIDASGATVQGFDFQGPGSSFGIIVSSNADGVTITDNRIARYAFGVFGVTPRNATTIGPDNDVTTQSGGVGIWLNGGTGDSVDDNYVGASTVGLRLVGEADATVTDNTFGSVVPSTIGISMSSDNSGSSITGNSITGHDVAIQVGPLATPAGAHDNDLSGNAKGIENLSDSVMDAARNWWGGTRGPSGWGIGTGSVVTQNVDFFPWYTDATRATLRACDFTASGHTVFGTRASEVFCGSPGDDLMFGRQGKDLLLGNGGHDLLYGRSGADSLIGGGGPDKLHGNSRFDSLQGWAGFDKCVPGGGGAQVSSCESRRPH